MLFTVQNVMTDKAEGDDGMPTETTATRVSLIRAAYNRYIVGAMSSMAFGLFASLIIGVIFTQLIKIPVLQFLAPVANMTQEKTVIGAAVGAAIAYGLKSKPLVIFASAVTGALGYSLGGPLGAFVAVIIGAEIAGLIAGKTPIDMILSPFVTIIAGGLTATWLAPYAGKLTDWLGGVINQWATLQPFVAGVLIALVVGMALTSPISSAGLCAAIGITGLASGAAVAGCAAQMVGFAVASYRDNGIGGLLSQGLGTSKLQLPNVLRKPQIWLAPSIASAVMGPIATCVFQISTSAPAAAGMGNCGLVGTLSILDQSGYSVAHVLIALLICFIAPAVLTLLFNYVFRKIKWVEAGDMRLSGGV